MKNPFGYSSYAMDNGKPGITHSTAHHMIHILSLAECSTGEFGYPLD